MRQDCKGETTQVEDVKGGRGCARLHEVGAAGAGEGGQGLAGVLRHARAHHVRHQQQPHLAIPPLAVRQQLHVLPALRSGRHPCQQPCTWTTNEDQCDRQSAACAYSIFTLQVLSEQQHVDLSAVLLTSKQEPLQAVRSHRRVCNRDGCVAYCKAPVQLQST